MTRLLPQAVAFLALAAPLSAAEFLRVTKVERQPLGAQAQRIATALDSLGAPLPDADKKALATAAADTDDARAVTAVQSALDKHCLAGVRVESDEAISCEAGPAKPALAQQGWRVFLVKVANAAGVTGVELRAD